MNKKTFITVAAVSVLSGGVVAATTAFAQTTQTGQNSPSLVQQIANKFHLNVTDVQSVFDQNRQKRVDTRETNYETYLSKLVKDGKINQEQEQLILEKHKELVSQMQSNVKNFKTMTPAERQAQMQTTKQDLQNWAKQNNIPLQYLRPFGSGKMWFIHKAITPTS